MRHPAGEPDDFERGANAAIGVLVPLGIGGGGGGEQGAGGGAARPVGERIGGAERLEFGHQRQGMRVAHDMGLDIGHRQGKAGALQQGAGIAHLHHGRHPRRSAAGKGEIGGKERLAQFGQAFSPDQRRHQQAIGLETGAQPRQMAGNVVDRLQMQQRDDQIVFLLGKERKFGFVGKGLDAGEMDRAGAGGKGLGQGRGVGSDEQSAGKIAHMGAEPVGEIGEHQIADEIVGALAAGEMAGDERGIEQGRRLGQFGKALERGLAKRPGRGNMDVMQSGGGQVKISAWLGRLGHGLGRVGQLALDQLYPPACAGCGAPLIEGDVLCAACFSQVRVITAPLCPVLGLPFASDLGAGALSSEALAAPPPFLRARAAVAYGAVADIVVSRLKYGDRPELARFCARLMAAAGREFWEAAPLLVPVPLHASRLRLRRYNQSLLLAQELGRQLELPVDPHLVQRRRNTRQQVGLSGDGRLRNVQGAFAPHPNLPGRLKGRGVVLIDDVYTTGATVKAATRALLRGGVERVEVLTFARVVIGGDLPI